MEQEYTGLERQDHDTASHPHADASPSAITGRIDKIALSLSGGGVRAVGFHLGTMGMLDRLGLLERVEIISTVSGGSMPGLGYALSQRFGRTFQDFFDDFYEFLPELNVVEELLERITARIPPAPSGRRDLITSLANIYHSRYFNRFFGEFVEGGTLTFDLLLDQPRQGHLKEMIFNATEFKTGSAFRFQVSEYHCLIGNGNVSICFEHARKIRLADIMAASSCIPVGMEPLFFPDDFHWPDDRWDRRQRKVLARPTCEEVRAALQRNTDTRQANFALMDGGVYDNQGITSTLLALNRRKTRVTERNTQECGIRVTHRGDPALPREWATWMTGKVTQGSHRKPVSVSSDELDLLIISDTPVRKASFFPRIAFGRSGDDLPTGLSPAPVRGLQAFLNKISLRTLNVVGWVMMVLLAWSAYLNVLELKRLGAFDLDTWFSSMRWLTQAGLVVVQVIIPLLVLIGVLLLLVTVKVSRNRTVEALQNVIPRWKKNPDRYLAKLRVGNLMRMASLRATSTSALTSTIYMNRIRGLGYSTAYSRADLRDRVVCNEIFTLQDAPSAQDPLHAELARRQAWPPPPELARIVDRAASMATKLWLDQDPGDPLNDLDYLVIGGQATLCYNLMRNLWDCCRRDGSFLLDETRALFERAVTEWQRLAADPLCLLRERKGTSRIEACRQWAEVN